MKIRKGCYQFKITNKSLYLFKNKNSEVIEVQDVSDTHSRKYYFGVFKLIRGNVASFNINLFGYGISIFYNVEDQSE